MKKQYNGKKLRYGSAGMVLTVFVIVSVILLNVVASALASNFSWMYVDMTPEELYSITDECFDLIRKEALPAIDEMRAHNKAYNESEGKTKSGTASDETTFVPRDEKVKIVFHFLNDRDVLMENSMMRYIIRSTEEITNMFPEYFEMVYINTDKNPSAVQKFKTTTLTTLNKTDIVVECGTEFRIIPYTRFFIYDETMGEYWAYDGEKQLASAILAITRAESPICLVDIAHGEKNFLKENIQLLYTIEDAGFRIAFSDTYLSDESIAEVEKEYGADVRLLLIFGPNSDFIVPEKGISDKDEIGALDRFLDGKSSMMVFMSPDSPVLPNLEEYLEEWGISFDRHTAGASADGYMIKDSLNSLTADGHAIVSEYVTTGTGGKFTEEMRAVPSPKKVIFRNAMSVSYSDLYTDTTYDPSNSESGTAGEVYKYGYYYKDGTSRSIYDLFRSSASATAMAGGNEVAHADEFNRFRFMTVSCEMRTTQENSYSEPLQENSYVIACGSTDFASDSYLQSAVYGNTDVLLSALRVVGREPVPVGITLKPFGDYTIDSITTASATAWTICLAVIPAAAALITGTVILVRRKYA